MNPTSYSVRQTMRAENISSVSSPTLSQAYHKSLCYLKGMERNQFRSTGVVWLDQQDSLWSLQLSHSSSEAFIKEQQSEHFVGLKNF